MKQAYKKTFQAMVVLLAMMVITPSFTADIRAQARSREASSEAVAVFTKFGNVLDGVAEAMTSILGRAVFFLVMVGCFICGIATKLPKMKILISAGSAMALQLTAEIEQLIWGA